MTAHNYLAAIGSVRVFETKLFSEAEKEKMLGASSFGEAFGMLNDLDFAPFLNEAEKTEDFESVLQSGLHSAKQELQRLAPHSKEMDVLWLQYDLHNAKVLLKSDFLKENIEDFDELLLPYGSQSPAKMKSLHRGETSEEKDTWIRMAFAKALQIYKSSQSPLEAEHVLDVAFFEAASRIAQKQKNRFVLDFVTSCIDRQNILIAFRFLLRDKSAESVPFLPGGTISQHALSDDMEHFGTHLPFVWKEAVLAGKQDFEKTGNLAILENKLSEVIMDLLGVAKVVIDGPEPLIAFFWKKHHNSQILRTLLVGKRAGISEENIRHILPKVY